MRKRLQKTFSLRVQLVLTGALLGAAAFLLLYGFSPLAFWDDTIVRGGYVERDLVQHYTGWLFYRNAPWTFPLGIAQNINWPGGAYVGFADSIPIAALFFKLLSPILPATFQYFGLWAFLCSVLQGAAAALLLSLFTQNRLYNGLFSLLFIFAPILWDRQLRHSALGAQWLILFALYLYFKHRRTGRFFSPGFYVLCALAMAIHPYFVPMVLALLFALLLENAIIHRRVWPPLASLGLGLAATLATGFVLGAFSGGGGGSSAYGYFSMNLNALFNPKGYGGYDWSLFLPQQNQVLGNYDGFNYLGLGLLLALAVIGVDTLIHLKKWPVWGFIKRRFAILLVGLCLTVFAVSNTVTAQGRVWFNIPLPGWLLSLASNFRSSGRMFYPVWYLLLLCACVWCLRRFTLPKWRTLAACGLVAVQLVDLSPALLQKAQDFRPYSPVDGYTLQSPFWQVAGQQYNRIASLNPGGLTARIDVALFAADYGMVTDDPFTARYDPAQRDISVERYLNDLDSRSFSPDTLYITSTESVFLNRAEALSDGMFCAAIDGVWFVFAPYTDTFTGMSGAGIVPIEEYPLRILDFSDRLWDHGVLTTDRRVVAFEDTAFARRRIEGMRAFEADGIEYPILEISYRDAGWIMVTLDTDDATPLQGAQLWSLT